ncbi:MAG: serine/threonine-protein phosphatase [Gemmatimonadota bacterium]|nr:serine/threonine-protein phosphatase [Gemmatimonadota bacterium]MDE3127802.1 serine/threonine-protein phosphatase [Gemmatimonadota bacterium]MDE3172117.1 serine/threonine-protein phosphatase [Gemmatimonadota bacterium]MDE3215414.1 serine/threonine-protein phosphatase [Gemmatimonadota bacterium]
MASPPSLAGAIAASPRERPRDQELDLYGLTHPGLVREENQDHFLLATVHPQVVIHGTSLPDPGRLPTRGERVATLMLVADGVGGGADGGQASKLAVESVMRYVSSTMRCCHAAVSGSDAELFASLVEAAGKAHAAVQAEAESRQQGVMATTLTLAVAVWPAAFVVQVGDSRCYFYSGGQLRQVTRDQTVAQDLVDMGVLPPTQAAASPYRHVLARAIGADEATPEVHRLDISERGSVLLLCSDGLTKHVADEEIAGHVRVMQSSEQLCRSLVELALARGGTDNVTVIAGRAVRA